jgi:hypothetical protein
MSLSLTLPTGNDIDTGMPTVGYNQSFQWSVINLSTSTGNVNMISSAGHSYVGNPTLGPDESYRFLTVKKTADTAITYRICGNSLGGNISSFWVSGKVDGNNLNVLSTRGRSGFSVSRPNTGTFPIGVYYIQFDIPYDSDNYVINTTNQMTGHCKVWDSPNYLPNANGFYIVTYNTSNTLANSVFYLSVIA